MSASTSSRLRAAGLAAALLALVVGAGLEGGPAVAQGVDCEALRQRMAALNQPDAGREVRFERAIQQQRSELARTQAYSDGIGCGGLAGLFGSAPAQCDGIANRISRMQTNLDSLEAQARTLRNGDPDQMAELAARYDASCRNAPDGGDMPIYSDPGLVGSDGNASIMDEGETEAHPQGGGKAICVRTCDGGYFPLASSVNGESLDGLQALCSAQCPNTEAKLYTTHDTDDIAGAVALDGSAYAALPAAFKFQKSHDAACTCKPPDQSWVQALAKAEDMLDKTDTHDVTVTEKMSADMARPSQATPAPPRKSGKRRNTLDLPPPALPPAASIGTRDPSALRSPPDGANRTVRTVAPEL